jgi:hypothetical protein
MLCHQLSSTVLLESCATIIYAHMQALKLFAISFYLTTGHKSIIHYATAGLTNMTPIFELSLTPRLDHD